MGLFFDILSSLNDPKQQGTMAHLSQVMGDLDLLRDRHGIDDATLQSLMSALGIPMQDALQRRSSGQFLGSFLNQFASNPARDLNHLFPLEQRHQMMQGLAQRSGIDETLVRSLLPTLVPLVIRLLNLGSHSQDANANNPVLQQFIQGDRPDLGEVVRFAQRFLHPAIA